MQFPNFNAPPPSVAPTVPVSSESGDRGLGTPSGAPGTGGSVFGRSGGKGTSPGGETPLGLMPQTSDVSPPNLRASPSVSAPNRSKSKDEQRDQDSSNSIGSHKGSDKAERKGNGSGSDDVEIVGSTSRPQPNTPPSDTKPTRPAGGSGGEQRSGGGAATQKPLRQSVLSFGISQEPQLRKELTEKEKQLMEASELIKQLQVERDRLDRHVKELAEKDNEEIERISRYQAVMREAMQQQAETQRRDARRTMHNEHFNLGQVTVATGMLQQEMWVHGNRFREIMAEIAQNEARLVEVEQSKKEAEQTKRLSSTKLSRASRQQARDGDETENSNGFANPVGVARGATLNHWLDAEEMAEIHKRESVEIKARIEALEKEKAELDTKRVAFLKECRRIEDEDRSSFAHITGIGEEMHHENKKFNRYVLLCLLGKGGFSEVWKAFDLKEGRFVACKIHHIDPRWSEQVKRNYILHAERELKIQEKLDHPRLVKLYDVFQYDPMTFVSVMEYCGGLDLDALLKKQKTLREADAKLIMKQIVSGLRALSETEDGQRVIHYDLKPANILFASSLSSCMEVKITDFGLSKLVQAQGNEADPNIELTSQGTGTFWYLPPECFGTDGPRRISHKVDIWAAGVIFYQMLYGRRPFADGESQREIWNQDLISRAVAKGLEFPSEPKVSGGAKALIQACLAPRPQDRPDIMELSSHGFFFADRKRPRGLMEAVAVNQMAPPAPVLPGAGLATQKDTSNTDAPPVAPALRPGGVAHRENQLH